MKNSIKGLIFGLIISMVSFGSYSFNGYTNSMPTLQDSFSKYFEFFMGFFGFMLIEPIIMVFCIILFFAFNGASGYFIGKRLDQLPNSTNETSFEYINKYKFIMFLIIGLLLVSPIVTYINGIYFPINICNGNMTVCSLSYSDAHKALKSDLIFMTVFIFLLPFAIKALIGFELTKSLVDTINTFVQRNTWVTAIFLLIFLGFKLIRMFNVYEGTNMVRIMAS